MSAAVLEREAPTSRTRTSQSRSGQSRSGQSRSAQPRTQRRTAPDLRVLDQQAIRRRARRRNALVFLFVAVIVGFFAVAFVHAALVAGQQELDGVRAQISQAEARHAELARAVDAASAPDVIATRAIEELGMVRAHQPVYLEVAAPLRDVEVIPMNASPTAVGSADPVSKVAAPVPVDEDGDAIADDVTGTGGSTISATIGIEAGVSAAGQLPEPSDGSIAIAAARAPAGASALAGAAGSATATSGSESSGSESTGSESSGGSVGAGTGASTGGGQGGTASIAGTRAVSGGTGSG